MQLIVYEHRNTHNTLTVKNDARRQVKNLILISPVLGLGLGLEPQVLVNITGPSLQFPVLVGDK